VLTLFLTSREWLNTALIVPEAMTASEAPKPNKGFNLCLLFIPPLFSTFSVVVRFKAVGSAPILKQSVFKISESKEFSAIVNFLRKELGYSAHESVVSPFKCLKSNNDE
jgi:hypothetical protein